MKKIVLLISLLTCGILPAFGQGSQFRFLWTNVDIVGNEDWYPLRYNCENPLSDTLRDGTVVRIFRSPGTDAPDPANDVPLTVGHEGGAGEIWPANDFPFNAADVAVSGATDGSFYTDFFQFEGGVPPSFTFFIYLQIGCWDEGHTEWHCAYYSHRMAPTQGYVAYMIGSPAFNPFQDAIWTCVDSCPEPVESAAALTNEFPLSFALDAYPNPFNPETLIRFSIPQTAQTSLTVYDLTGRVVATLTNDVLQSGRHEVVFDAAELPAGIYFAYLQSAQTSLVRKIVLLK